MTEIVLYRAFWHDLHGGNSSVSNRGRKIILEAIEDGKVGQETLELYDEISVLWRKSVAANRKLSKSRQLTTAAILNRLLEANKLPMLPVPRPSLRFIRGGKA